MPKITYTFSGIQILYPVSSILALYLSMVHPEKIIWEGKPQYKLRWAFLEIFGGGRSIIMIMLIPILLVSIVFGLIWAHENGEWFIAFLLYFFISLILFGPEAHKFLRRKYTFYQVTENYILIHDYWYGKKYHHVIHLGEVVKFYLENFNDNVGVIHLFMKEKCSFVTRDFWSGNPRFHLTFEDVYPADEIYKNLRIYLMDWKRRNPTPGPVIH